MAEGEELSGLLQLTPEKLLLRWINFQLHSSAYTGIIDSFGDSLKDGLALSVLVRTVAPDYCSDVPATLAGNAQCCLLKLTRCMRLANVDFVATWRMRVLVLSPAASAMEHTALLTAVMGAAFGAGVPQWFSVEAVSSANVRLQLAFVASLYNVTPNLPVPASVRAAAAASEASSGSAGAGVAAGASAPATSPSSSGDAKASKKEHRFTVKSVQVA